MTPLPYDYGDPVIREALAEDFGAVFYRSCGFSPDAKTAYLARPT